MRSQKDRAWDAIREGVVKIKNARKNEDWSVFQDEFEAVNKKIEKSKMLIMRDGLPKFYIKMLAEVEDIITEVMNDKAGFKNLKQAAQHSLKRMKLNVKKHNANYETQIANYRAKPEDYKSDNEDDSDSDDSDSDDDSDDDDDSDKVRCTSRRLYVAYRFPFKWFKQIYAHWFFFAVIFIPRFRVHHFRKKENAMRQKSAR